MVRTPSYVIRALRLLGVDVRSVEVEVKGEVNDRNRAGEGERCCQGAFFAPTACPLDSLRHPTPPRHPSFSQPNITSHA